jgi:glycosyltransferase involved in cell wall biosynthesis
MQNHTFVICAYKQSRFLEDCIKSLINQDIKSKVIISTSTPNEYINNLALKYNLPVYVNSGEKGIGQDWNFGISKTETKFVTIAHQDDVYEENYLEEILKIMDDNTVISFTKYKEIKNGEVIDLNKNLKIKEVMLLPFKIFKRSKFIKKLILSLGSPICCPSVTLNIDKVGKTPFVIGMKSNLDWDTWVRLASIKGKYLYIDKYLMYHRIHEESETSKTINNNVRIEEDYIMFRKFWPKVIADMLIKKYKKAVETNG